MSTPAILLISLTFSTTALTLFYLSICPASTSPLRASATTGGSLGTFPRNYEQVSTIMTSWQAALGLLAVPYVLQPQENPLIDCVARVVCFFYSCKILDLGFRAWNPPMLREKQGRPQHVDWKSTSKLNYFVQKFRYISLLLTEARYSSFDIAIKQKGRRAEDSSRLWTFCPVVVIPVLTYLLPVPETKSLLVLLTIQLGLEGLHCILHSYCPNYLFWQPFAASSLTDFWRTHWHAGAESFLRTLAYKPASNFVLWAGGSKSAARAFGVLAAFSLSGIWHAWATAALTMSPWSAGVQVWIFFIGMGIGVLLESFVPRKWRGSLLHRICVWIYFTSYAGWAWRGVQSNCKIAWLAQI